MKVVADAHKTAGGRVIGIVPEFMLAHGIGNADGQDETVVVTDMAARKSKMIERSGGFIVLPGGVANPDQLRANEDAVKFVRAFFDAGKPVAAICHAPWLLIEAGVVEGRTLTAYPSIRTDLRNAGATVVDEEVVVDDGLVTSRNPDDIPAFNAKMIEEFAEGRHDGQQAA